MSWYSRESGRHYYGYPPYVSVEQKKIENARLVEKLTKENPSLQPVVIQGRSIAKSFWAKAWCSHIEQFQDYENRLPRGRSYVRQGAVVDLKLEQGSIKSMVAGSYGSPYDIEMTIKPLSPERKRAIVEGCAGRLDSVLALMQGKMSKDLQRQLCQSEAGLFPTNKDLSWHCSCPDSARMCKHIAATLYGVGARLDEEPSLLFLLRGIELDELVAGSHLDDLTAGLVSEIDMSRVADIFGVTFDCLDEDLMPVPDAEPSKSKSKKPLVTLETLKWGKTYLNQLRRFLNLNRAQFAAKLRVKELTLEGWEERRRVVSDASQLRIDIVARDSGFFEHLAQTRLNSELGKQKPTSLTWNKTNLTKLRKKLGLRRDQLAERLLVKLSTLDGWESRRRKVSPAAQDRIDELARDCGLLSKLR